MGKTTFLLALLTLSIAAMAGEDGANKEPQCEQPGMSEADRFFCWRQQSKAADEAVQREYSFLVKELAGKPAQLQMLFAAHEAWKSYREATARYDELARKCSYGQACLSNNTIYFKTHQSISARRLGELKSARELLAVLGVML